MPIPFLLIGGVLAGLAGLGAASEASENREKAQAIGERAERTYRWAEEELDEKRSLVNEEFENFGEYKIQVFTNQIKYLVEAIKRAKSKKTSSQLKDLEVLLPENQMKQLEVSVQRSLEIEKGIGSGLAAGAATAAGVYGAVGMLASASTGTAIASLSGVAATNATLAWLGGGSLAAGGGGVALGSAALGGLVAGPAILIAGFWMASKAEEALTEARAYEAKVDRAVAEMDKLKTVMDVYLENVEELASVIEKVVLRFEEVKVPDDSNPTRFAQMVTIGKMLKNLLDIPVMDQQGKATSQIQTRIRKVLEV